MTLQTQSNPAAIPRIEPKVKLRPLERSDLGFVHKLNNNDTIMRYWFEEPYETQAELFQLYDTHVHDQRERRFIVENEGGDCVGLVELIEIDHIHRRGEFQIIVAPSWQGRGYARATTLRAIDYAFGTLNLRKLYLVVDKENVKAVHIYEKCGFKLEAELVDEFFINGAYRTAKRMRLFQHEYLKNKP